ncbi:MAG: tRNA pseudouridine(38-40) synthase TruA [Desulfarculaceae bacterium]|nr:tRNA pseudouridine(38-40) synthase TruA [Desulfarculaceae bacterium]MCF8070964.1 tRNA pseudouridine(38-40) synthase TruA [Desulfarculaceae bacterium]MCF8100552.1 tRNA pseudouridine(38-40) synthase TruA [Desulfarculaceae bacterium]MCF8116578.1 tRNA pseudouridine(38-40) synthase TruA [Desulfarculaceae bacterium]
MGDAIPGLWERLAGRFPALDVPFARQEPEGDTRRLALALAYRGAGFAGWQVQPGEATVQGAVEAALSRLCDEPVRVEASGRTDAGVNAWGQVASFSTHSRLAAPEMLRGLRALLPGGIWPRALGPVEQEFHARYNARGKTYHYYFWPKAEAALFLEPHCWPLKAGLDLAAMGAALEELAGEVDLAAFSTAGSDPGLTTKRRIYRAELNQLDDGLVELRLTASGFLRHSVRNLAGSLAQVGRGELRPAALAEMALAGQRLYSGPKAPPQGLYLAQVFYTREPA